MAVAVGVGWVGDVHMGGEVDMTATGLVGDCKCDCVYECKGV